MAGATELAQYPGFTISIAPTSSFTTKLKVAHVDSATFSDAFDIATVTDFDTALQSIAAKILTDRSVSVSFSVNLQMSDPAWVAINTAYRGGTHYYMEIALTDTKTTATVGAIQLGGYFGTRGLTLQKPVATGQLTFEADEVVSDTLG